MALYQTSFWDNQEIYKNGCLFMSLIELAQRMSDRQLEKRDINNMYVHCIKVGYMDKHCYIYDHNKIINEALSFLIKPEIRAKYTSAQYIETPEKNWGKNKGDYKIIQVKTLNLNSHFMVLDNINPYDPYKPSVKFDRVLSIRYYDIV